MVRQLLAVTGLALGLAGIGLFLAVGVWAWHLKAEVNRQTEYLAGQANRAGAAADHAIKFVGEVIQKAHADLAVARRQAPSAPEPVSPLVRVAARQASHQLAGDVERVIGAVVAASDAVVVVDAALDVVSDDQGLKQLFGVRPEQVSEVRGTLGSVADELRKARSVLGVPVGDGPLPTAEELDAVNAALRLADGVREEMARVVEVARQRVNGTRRTIDLWAVRAAVGATALCALGMLGQFFLARFCWRTLRRLPA